MGRDAEMALFQEALRDPTASAFAIHGPTGVGRSRMAEECLAAMERAGLRALRVQGSAELSSVPFGAVAHLLARSPAFDGPQPAFTAAARLIADLEGRRLNVVVDDAHLLDTSSVVLLGQLMDAGAVFLVVALRSDGEVGDAVVGLLRTDAAYRVDLRHFSHSTAETLLRKALGGVVERRTMQELMDVSHGNALFLRELVVGAMAEGRLVSDGEVWELSLDPRMTPTLADLVRARVARGGREGRRVLDLLAVCGPVPLADAETESDRPVIVGLEEADLVRTHLEGRRAVVELSHPLFAEVLRSDLTPQHRTGILLRQIRRTERYGMRRTTDSLRVAHWHLEAAGTAEVELLEQAAAQAHASYEYSQVIALLGGVPATSHTTRSRVLLGGALSEVGEFDEAESVLRAAQEHAAGEDEALSVLQVRVHSLFMDGQVDLALAIARKETAALDSPRARELRVLSEASMVAVAGDPVRADRLFRTLTDDIHRAAEPGAWLRARSMKAVAMAVQGRTDAALDVVRAAREVHSAPHGEESMPHPASHLVSAVLAHADAGRFGEAAEAGALGRRELADTDLWLVHLWLVLHMGRAAWLEGRPATARRLFGEAAAQARRVNHRKALRLALSGLAASAAAGGDVEAAAAAVRESADYPVSGYLAGEERLGEAWVHVATGDRPGALRVLAEAAASARRTGHLTSEGLLLTDMARFGDPSGVARLGDIARRCDGLLAPARAFFAEALAEDDGAGLSGCADDFEALGADLLTAEAHMAAADSWRRAGRDREATGAAVRGRAALARCEDARTPLVYQVAGTPAALLTPRERQIAFLAVEGLTSQDIADRLMFSVRTIHNGLQAVYKKIGVSNRRQLTEHLDRYLTLTEGGRQRAVEESGRPRSRRSPYRTPRTLPRRSS
ncbi:LuxR C-terminal-related transcriptional regulator [Streptomyces sp. ODS05-4]|uniref:LuxR C-terminal-related transcriptional regulator n=1 Tax=Streptomyces sp. ODS05-4 TaxID=2944939 RepID=UPI0035B23D62